MATRQLYPRVSSSSVLLTINQCTISLYLSSHFAEASTRQNSFILCLQVGRFVNLTRQLTRSQVDFLRVFAMLGLTTI